MIITSSNYEENSWFTKQVVNMAKVDDRTYLENCVGHPPLKIILSNYMKIMLLVFLKLKQIIKLSLSPSNSFILMSFKRIMKLMFHIYDHVIIW